MCFCCFHCNQSLCDTLTVDVPHASAAAVWKTLTQVEAYPHYMSQVSSVYWPHGHGVPMQQGFSWRETRIFDAKCHILHKTVTQLVEPTTTEHDEDDSNYSVSINVALDVETRPSYEQVVHTCTITIIPYRDQIKVANNKGQRRTTTPGCRIVASWGWLPAGWYNRLEVLLCGSCIKGLATRSFEVELQEMAEVATKQHMEAVAASATESSNTSPSTTTVAQEAEEVVVETNIVGNRPATEQVDDTATAFHSTRGEN